MSNGNFYTFVEGQTEERLLKILGCQGRIIDCKGKDEMPEEVKKILGDELGKQQPVSVLILRDRDHNETYPDIKLSFESVINSLLREEIPDISDRHFLPNEGFDNLFVMDASNANFCAILHIAKPPCNDMGFASETTDGYILALAMCENVLQRFAGEAGFSSERLKAKVLEEVPRLATENGIIFNQAKDFIGIYMAMSKFFTIKRSERDDAFSGVVINRAKRHANDDYLSILSSHMAALQFLGAER